MEKKILKMAILSLTVTASVFFISVVFAQTTTTDVANIQYPVPRLGNCKSETDCRNFCDKPENIESCLNFAEENNLMPKEEIETARKFTVAGNKGPGGCTGKDSCESFCNDISNIDECVSFAEQNNFLPPKELEEAKKVQAAIKRGVKPPPCGNKKACDNYCEDPNHMEECIAFAQEAGFMNDRELAESQKVLQAIKRGVKPPPCKGKESCDQYCQQPDNIEACMNFAIEAGLMDDKEKEDSQKMLSAIKNGVKPPNCRGKEECDNYCQEDAHFDECTNFAEAAGFMNAKEAEMARKTRGKGPGDCKSKEECESFCNDPANQEICFKFGEENGLIPEEQIKEMKEGMGRMREGLNNAPPEVKDCLKSAMGEDTINKIQSGKLTPGPQIGDQMRSCFEKFPPKEMTPPGMMPRPDKNSGPTEDMTPQGRGEFQGPGGCSSPEECRDYCLQNPEACRDFQKPGNEQRPVDSPHEFEGQPLSPGLNRNQLQPPREPREGEKSREWQQEVEERKGQVPLFHGQMPPGGQIPGEFQQQGMPSTGGMSNPPPEFESQPSPLPQPKEGQFSPPPPEMQAPPLEQAPQIQQNELAPPPLSPPPETEQPQSLRNSIYLGAIIRFLLGAY